MKRAVIAIWLISILGLFVSCRKHYALAPTHVTIPTSTFTWTPSPTTCTDQFGNTCTPTFTPTSTSTFTPTSLPTLTSICGSGSFTVGKTTTTGSTGSNDWYIVANKVFLSTGGTAWNLSTYSPTAYGQARMAIYTDSYNSPNQKVFETPWQALVIGWNLMPIPKVYLESNYYWIALQINSQAQYVYETVTNDEAAVVMFFNTLTPMPQFFNMDQYAKDRFAIHADFCPGAVSATITPVTSRTPTFTPTPTNTFTPTFTPIPPSRVVGSTGSANGNLNHPMGLCVDASNNIYVADSYNYRVEKFSSSGAYLGKFGGYGSGSGQFMNVTDVAVDLSGNLYVTDNTLNNIFKFDSSFNILTQWGSAGSGDGQLSGPNFIACKGSEIYVTETGNRRVQVFDTSGGFLRKWGSSGAGNGQFSTGPNGIALDNAGNVYVAQCANVQKFSSNGAFMAIWSTVGGVGLDCLLGLAVDGSGNIYLGDYSNDQIIKMDQSGNLIKKWGYSGTGLGDFDWPYDLAINSTGEAVVSDYGNGRLQIFAP